MKLRAPRTIRRRHGGGVIEPAVKPVGKKLQ
jgi:hypothetical protein